MKKTHGRIIAFLMAVILSFSFITYSGVSYTEASAAAKKTVNIKKPPKPRTSKVKTNSVKLKWSKVKGAKTYKVYRSTNKKKWKLIKTTKGTSLTVKKLKADKKYYFRIRAFRNKVKSPYSKIVSVKTKKVATTEKPEANVPQNTTNVAIPTVTAPADVTVPTAPQQPTIPDTTAPASTTAPGATEAPETTAPDTTTEAPDATTEAPETTAPDATEAPENLPATKEEIAKAYNDVVNACKAYNGRVTITETESVNIAIPDLPTFMTPIINSIVENFAGTTERSWTFENTVDVDEPYRDISYVIMPYFAEANVLPEGLASARATANDDGGYTMEIVFVAEDSTFDGISTINEPVYHMGALQPLDLSALNLDPVTIKHAELHYPGATILATVDAQGRLVKLDSLLPVEGSAMGKLGGISLSINANGSLQSVCELVYES